MKKALGSITGLKYKGFNSKEKAAKINNIREQVRQVVAHQIFDKSFEKVHKDKIH